MSIYGLSRVFTPQSLAIVGAGPDRSSLGGAVYANAQFIKLVSAAGISRLVGVETLNLIAAARRKRRAEGKDGEGV